MSQKKTILLIFIFFISCKSHTTSKNLDINFYPDFHKIKKEYQEYYINNPLQEDNKGALFYTKIEHSKYSDKRPKILIPHYEFYNDSFLLKYIKKNMNGEYESYISKNGNVEFFNSIKSLDFDKKNIISLAKIEEYFKKQRIGYRIIDKKDDSFAFLLSRKNATDSSFCFIITRPDYLKVNLYYNKKDTIKSLSSESYRIYEGGMIED